MIADSVSFRNEAEVSPCLHGKCVPGIETRAKPEITMAINNILAAQILSAISAVFCSIKPNKQAFAKRTWQQYACEKNIFEWSTGEKMIKW